MQTPGYEEWQLGAGRVIETAAQSRREFLAGSQARTQKLYEPAARGVQETYWMVSQLAVPIRRDHDATRFPLRVIVIRSRVLCVLSRVRYLSLKVRPTFPEFERARTPGLVMSMKYGPRCAVALQLPTLSRVRIWNHHVPVASRGLVAVWAPCSFSFVRSGSVLT
jgi:hypothetical protein